MVCFAGLVAFGRSVHSNYVTLDSAWLTTENPLLSEGSVSVLPKIWADFSVGTRLTLGAEYLPVRDMSVWLDFLCFGDRWAGHHAVNLALYLLGTLLFHRLAVKLWTDLKGPGPAALWGLWVGLLFAVHPVHAESVVWLASRKDMLALVFGLSAVLFWRNREAQSLHALWALFATLLAIWSKNIALTLPFVFLALDGIERPERLRSPRFWAAWAPFGTLAIACALLSQWVGHSVGMFTAAETGLLDTLALQGAALWHYAHTLLWPTKLAIFYDLEPSNALLGWALVSVVVFGVWKLGGAARIAFLGAVWFALTVAPTSTFVQLQNVVADRYLLLPSAGFCLLLGSTIAILVERRPELAGPIHLLLGLAVASLAFTAYQRVGAWHSSATLYNAGIASHPHEVRHYVGLAGAQIAEGRSSEAREVIDAGLEQVGRDPRLLQTLGWIQTLQDQPEAAKASLEEALSANPHLRKANNNLAMLQLRAGEHAAARATAESLVQTHPLYANGWTTLGAIALQQRDLDPAERALLHALTLSPYSATAHCNLGGTHWLQGRPQDAVLHWEACLKADPQNPQALGGLRAAKQAANKTSK